MAQGHGFIQFMIGYLVSPDNNPKKILVEYKLYFFLCVLGKIMAHNSVISNKFPLEKGHSNNHLISRLFSYDLIYLTFNDILRGGFRFFYCVLFKKNLQVPWRMIS